MHVPRIPKRIVKEAISDNITGEAAKAAYYFFLSLFPLILAAFAMTGILGGNAAFEFLMGYIEEALPEGAEALLSGVVREITMESRPDMLSLGLLLALWGATNFFAALGDGLDAMFEVRDQATWWKKRLKSLLLVVFGLLLGAAAATGILAGPQIASAVGLDAIAPWLTWLVWPIGFALVTGLFWLTYFILPARDQGNAKQELLIGAVVGTLLWLLATAAFRFYVSNFGNFSATYGAVGAIIVLLLWLYITAIVILLGGEVADVLLQERGKKPMRGQS